MYLNNVFFSSSTHPGRSLLIFAFLHSRCHGDGLVTVLRPGVGRVSRGDAVVAFPRRAHTLPVAGARLIELHGRPVLHRRQESRDMGETSGAPSEDALCVHARTLSDFTGPCQDKEYPSMHRDCGYRLRLPSRLLEEVGRCLPPCCFCYQSCNYCVV